MVLPGVLTPAWRIRVIPTAETPKGRQKEQYMETSSGTKKESDAEDSAIWKKPNFHGMTSPSCASKDKARLAVHNYVHKCE